MADCWVCKNLENEEWNGDSDVSHCKECHALWRRESIMMHCVMCHKTFSTPSTLEAHKSTYRDKNGDLRSKCHDPSTRTTSSGELIFGAPTPNSYGTPVWRRTATPEYLPPSSTQ